ncbi:MAG: hypothetical protein ACJA0N_002723 [Pseudohongiellaceae bacterium]|jgi:hypothetical protein
MRIKDVEFNVEAKAATLIELKDLLIQPSDQQSRPCPGCRFVTPDGKTENSATKYCSYRCSAAPREMSAEPDRYPIESGIVPAVYAFYTLRKLMPCWSCEGHLDGNNVLSKSPKVWFYATSGFYPKLITQSISQLEMDHKLINSWIVRILPFSQSMFTITYSLEPLLPLKRGDDTSLLLTLRKDIVVIADNLRPEMLQQARSYLAKGEKSPFKS